MMKTVLPKNSICQGLDQRAHDRGFKRAEFWHRTRSGAGRASSSRIVVRTLLRR